MIRIITLLSLFAFFASISLSAQEKKVLSPEDLDDWNGLTNPQISTAGNWATYEIAPYIGDGYLWLYSIEQEEYKDFARGYQARIAPDESFMAFKIRPAHDTLRQAKLDGLKKDELPKDSLGIYLIEKDSLIKVEKIKSFKLPTEGSSWLAWLRDKKKEPADTTSADTTAIEEESSSAEASEDKEKKKPKQEGKTLEIFHPQTGTIASYDHVTDYSFSKKGQLFTFISTRKDSIDSVFVHYMVYPGIQSQIIYAGPGYAKSIQPDEQGNQAAFLFSADTGKVKVYDLCLWHSNNNDFQMVVNKDAPGMPEGACVSENSSLYFSESGRRLFFGTAEIPVEEPEDTLTDDEKVSVDIWNWKDDRLQPMQLKQLESDKKKAYEAVYHIPTGGMVQLATEEAMRLRIDKKRNGPYMLGMARKPYMKEVSWDADSYQDIYLINIANGKRQMVVEKLQSSAYLSPQNRYVAYYDELDSSWNSYSVKTNEHFKLTEDLAVSFSYEEFDMPTTPGPYGMVGWTKNDKELLVYDRFDIWMLDPEGKAEPKNLTNGREAEMQYRYYKLDPDLEYVPKDEDLLLRGFNENTKDAGFFHLNINKDERKKLVMGPYSYYVPKKAKEGSTLIWQRMNFHEYPDLYVSDLDFGNTKKISDANPQQSEYLWGSVEMVHWTSADGVELDGLLYKPEDFDPKKKYPVVVYFYETYSNGLHRHHVPKPSRSTVNFSYYASNGYVVFVPDIVYKTGFPGQSAYNSVVSGTLKLMENEWVDAEHIGIQGQSWGGYQVAYLVTQTNMFAAGMAGAPVSNMTSAYGGIRWGSGMSRMFQYEGSQSRLGGTLWERPWRYIENSPVFFADKVETPLLMMHNDKDGAVPWYQGIEYFVALRRLNKPVWMLNYNGAPHNLSRKADCKDLTIRMQQFFDHYLKGAPAPVWMDEGIPAIKKGKEMGYKLIRD